MNKSGSGKTRRIRALFFFSSIVFAFMLSACQKPADQNIVIDPNDPIVDFVTGKPKTGIIIDTLDSRIIEFEVIDGIKNGSFRVSHLDGHTIIEGTVKNNKNEGLWKYYYQNSALESEGAFRNDVPEGKWTWYFPDGDLKEVGFFRNGLKEGKWLIYDETGTVSTEITFNNDQVVNKINKKETFSL